MMIYAINKELTQTKKIILYLATILPGTFIKLQDLSNKVHAANKNNNYNPPALFLYYAFCCNKDDAIGCYTS